MAAWEDRGVRWPLREAVAHAFVLLVLGGMMVAVALVAYRELMAVTRAFPF